MKRRNWFTIFVSVAAYGIGELIRLTVHAYERPSHVWALVFGLFVAAAIGFAIRVAAMSDNPTRYAFAKGWPAGGLLAASLVALVWAGGADPNSRIANLSAALLIGYLCWPWRRVDEREVVVLADGRVKVPGERFMVLFGPLVCPNIQIIPDKTGHRALNHLTRFSGDFTARISLAFTFRVDIAGLRGQTLNGFDLAKYRQNAAAYIIAAIESCALVLSATQMLFSPPNPMTMTDADRGTPALFEAFGVPTIWDGQYTISVRSSSKPLDGQES